MLRADLHHHFDADPIDGHFIHYSIGALIDRAAALGLNVLGVTCHESIPYDDDAARYAQRRGVLLLRGMEATVDGTHMLLLNFPEFPAGVCTIADVAAHKTRDSLVIAPHPFYPTSVAAGGMLREHRAVFDAVEFSGLYTALTGQFNRRAAQHGRRVGLPIVGNTDTHFLWQIGHTYTLIDAPPNVPAVIDAIRHGRVHLVTRPLAWTAWLRFGLESGSGLSMVGDALGSMMKVLRRTRRHGRGAARRTAQAAHAAQASEVSEARGPAAGEPAAT